MVGDRENDILAGAAGGCRTALIGNENFGQDLCVESPLQFVDTIF